MCAGDIKIFLFSVFLCSVQFSNEKLLDERPDLESNYDLIENATLTTNATCGERRKEHYCPFFIHLNTKVNGQNGCGICDSKVPNLSHPIEYAKADENGYWWQSPSLANGREYQRIDIHIDLRDIFVVNSFSMAVGNSPPPGEWILEASKDNVTFKRWVCFAPSISRCQRLCGNVTTTTNYIPNNILDNETYCTTYFSRIYWVSDQEIAVRLTDGRSSLLRSHYSNLSSTLTEFLSARYIRIALHRVLAQSLVYMSKPSRDQSSNSHNRLYYTIKKIMVNGKCQCNQHAVCERVPYNNQMITRCDCKHETEGKHCEICKPLYNQQPWHPGKPCERCNCHGKATSCYYNQTVANLQMSKDYAGGYNGGGVCVNCVQNTDGINCESCKPGYYRPIGTSPDNEYPCERCDCNSDGSLGDCIPNEDSNKGNPGDCICRAGYTGAKCEDCAKGYYPVSGTNRCEACQCDIGGSLGDNNYQCTAPCNCKTNVDENQLCRSCNSGSFGLDPKKPDGCTPCFCFGLSKECRALPYGSVPITTLDGWIVKSSLNNRIIAPTSSMEGVTVRFSTSNAETTDRDMLYWVAPAAFHGNLLSMYGSLMKFVITSELRDPNLAAAPNDPDVIIGGNNMMIGWTRIPFQKPHMTYELVVSEKGDSIGRWYHLADAQTRNAEKVHIMTVLANVTLLMVKAKHFHMQTASSLKQFSIQVADPNAVGELTNVEQCQCPPNYAGTSCESCLPGFVRRNGIYKGRCVRCIEHCRGLTDECDPNTGECINCKNNTRGEQCSDCIPGYYRHIEGSGTTHSCRLCECPRNDYKMSSVCTQTNRPGSPRPYVCLSCANNTHGQYCETCIRGHFGDPQRKIPCRPCPCNSNEESCNPLTGECKCDETTEGENCELCKKDHFGDAISNNCSHCECFPSGSQDTGCDMRTGQCVCKSNYAGLKCDQCADGYGNLAEQCLPCECNSIGTVDYSQRSCNPHTRQCHCKPGVEGLNCDKCKPGYYEFSNEGCKKCPLCSNGRICDGKTGVCECPPNTEGEYCEKCVKGSWGYHRERGCTPCACNLFGSSDICDINTGVCPCKPEFEGSKCSDCKNGYFGVDCQPCQCDPRGTESTAIDPQANSITNFTCDKLTGACNCRKNVKGIACDTCLENTSNLRKEEPLGCRECFCFGLSDQCQKLTGYQRVELPTVHKMVEQASYQSRLSSDVGLIPGTSDSTIYYPILQYYEVFLQVPELRGNLLNLYGGPLIKYHIRCGDTRGDTCRWQNSISFIVRVASNSSGMVLEYNVNQAVIVGDAASVVVVLNELLPGWFLTTYMRTNDGMPLALTGGSLNRRQSQAALHFVLRSVSSVEILIYSKRHFFTTPKFIQLTYNTYSVEPWTNSAGVTEVDTLQKCECPATSKGHNCEIPADGYFVIYVEIPNLKNTTGLLTYEKCLCNGFSNTCDSSTGECLNCTRNTAGKHCEVCTDGYYGDVLNNEDCKPCPCPAPQTNFGQSCERDSNDRTKFICRCKAGHRGERCDSCADGYFGRPMYNQSCEPCGCKPEGRYNESCDERGRCVCAPGITGDKCDTCQEDYAVINKTCVSCRTGCTRNLFLIFDQLKAQLINVNISIDKSELLIQIQKRVADLKFLFSFVNNATAMRQADDRLMEMIAKLNELQDKLLLLNRRLRDAKNATSDFLVRQEVEIQKYFQKTIDYINKVKSAYTDASRMDVAALIQILNDTLNKLSAKKNSLENLNMRSEDLESDINDFLDNVVTLTIQPFNISSMDIDVEQKRLNRLSEKYKEFFNLEDSLRQAIQTTNETLNYAKTVIQRANDFNESEKPIIATEYNQSKIIWNQIDIKMRERYNDQFQEAIKNLDAKAFSYQVPSTLPGDVQIFEDITAKFMGIINSTLVNSSRADLGRSAYYDIIKSLEDALKAINETERMQIEVKATFEEFSKSIPNEEAKLAERNKETEHIKKTLQNMNEKVQEMHVQQNRSELNQGRINDAMNILKIRLDKLYESWGLKNGSLESLRSHLNELNKKVSRWEENIADDNSTSDEKINAVRDKLNVTQTQVTTLIAKLNSTMERLNKLRENVTYLEIRAEKMMESLAFAHQAAVGTVVPFRCNMGCQRTYQLYFIKTSNVLSFEIWLKPKALENTDYVVMSGIHDATKNTLSVIVKDRTIMIEFTDYIGNKGPTLTLQNVLSTSEKHGNRWVHLKVKIFPFLATATATPYEPVAVFSPVTVSKQYESYFMITPNHEITIGSRDRSDEYCVYAAYFQDQMLGLDDFKTLSPDCQANANDQNPLDGRGGQVNCIMPTPIAARALYNRRPDANEDQGMDRFAMELTGNGYSRTNLHFIGSENSYATKRLSVARVFHVLHDGMWQPSSVINFYSEVSKQALYIWREEDELHYCMQLNMTTSKCGHRRCNLDKFEVHFRHRRGGVGKACEIAQLNDYFTDMVSDNATFMHIGRLPDHVRKLLNTPVKVPKYGAIGYIQVKLCSGASGARCNNFPPTDGSAWRPDWMNQIAVQRTRRASIVPWPSKKPYYGITIPKPNSSTVNEIPLPSTVDEPSTGLNFFTLSFNFQVMPMSAVANRTFAGTILSLKQNDNDLKFIVDKDTMSIIYNTQQPFIATLPTTTHTLKVSVMQRESFLTLWFDGDLVSRNTPIRVDLKRDAPFELFVGPFTNMDDDVQLWDIQVFGKHVEFQRDNRTNYRVSLYDTYLTRASLLRDANRQGTQTRESEMQQLRIKKSPREPRQIMQIKDKEEFRKRIFPSLVIEAQKNKPFQSLSMLFGVGQEEPPQGSLLQLFELQFDRGSVTISRDSSYHLIVHFPMKPDVRSIKPLSLSRWNKLRVESQRNDGSCCHVYLNEDPVVMTDDIKYPIHQSLTVLRSITDEDSKKVNRSICIPSLTINGELIDQTRYPTCSTRQIQKDNEFVNLLGKTIALRPKFSLYVRFATINVANGIGAALKLDLCNQIFWFINYSFNGKRFVLGKNSKQNATVFLEKPSVIEIHFHGNEFEYHDEIMSLDNTCNDLVKIEVFYGVHPEIADIPEKNLPVRTSRPGCIEDVYISVNNNEHWSLLFAHLAERSNRESSNSCL